MPKNYGEVKAQSDKRMKNLDAYRHLLQLHPTQVMLGSNNS
jgi:hypothetical protein